jgi:hypothetical protein
LARTLIESTLARDQSIPPSQPSWSNTTWCSRCHTPARCQSRSRRQQVHVLLSDLHPGGAAREPSATRAAALLRRVHPITVVDVERKRIARELLADVRRLDRQATMASQAIAPRSASPAPP